MLIELMSPKIITFPRNLEPNYIVKFVTKNKNVKNSRKILGR